MNGNGLAELCAPRGRSVSGEYKNAYRYAQVYSAFTTFFQPFGVRIGIENNRVDDIERRGKSKS